MNRETNKKSNLIYVQCLEKSLNNNRSNEIV